MQRALGEFELLLLFAVLRLGEDAYGASVLREIEQRAGREVTSGAVYTGLERLEAKRLVCSVVGEPTAERGGRRKRYFRLEPAGARTLADSFDAIAEMSRDLRPRLAAMLAPEKV